MFNTLASALKGDDRVVVAEMHQLLKAKSTRFSSSRLADLTRLAFEVTFTGMSREDKLAIALARGLSTRDKMAAEEGGSRSAEETARYLNLSKQSVLNLYHAGKLLGWRTEKQGAVRFPVWQFSDHARLPGLPAVLAKLNEIKSLDDWGKIGFFLQTHGILGGRRPLDLLRANNLPGVLKAVAAYGQ